MHLTDITEEALREVLISAGLDAADIETVVRNDEAETLVVERCDFRGKIGSIKRTDEGYLQGDAAVAKVGILIYYLPDGNTRRELVPAATLFAAASMDSLKLKPVTDTHPVQLVTSRTAGLKKVGYTGETVQRDGEHLKTKLVVTDAEAITSIEDGRQELSPGYRAEVLMRPGLFNCEPYDGIQVRRTYNHVALCDRARGGRDLRLNIDSSLHIDGFAMNEDAVLTFAQRQRLTDNPTPPRRSRFMNRINLDGVDYEADQQVINHVRRQDTRIEELTTELGTLKTDHETLTAERDTLKTKVDELEAAAKDETAIKARVDERLALVTVAKEHLDEETVKKVDSMTDTDIRKAVILKRFPDVKDKLDAEDTTEEYLNARYDLAVETLKTEKEDGVSPPPPTNTPLANQRGQAAPRQDAKPKGGERTQEQARADMEERARKSWEPETVKKD